MQALNLLPEDESIPLIEYQNKKLFDVLANISLPDKWLLQIEKLGNQVAQPSEMPQFNYCSRTTAVELNSEKNTAFVKST